jgi:hypothetical protein
MVTKWWHSFHMGFCISSACLLSNLLIGCTTVQPDAVSQFSLGVSKAQQQLDAAFHDANALAREEEISYVVSTNRPGITEADFTPALSPADAAAWDDAFGKIQAYATALKTLLAGNQGQQFSDAVVGLAKEVRSGSTGQQINPGVATAFTELASVLIDVKAQKNAQAAMKKADPAIHETLVQMAQAIGSSNAVGVRSTVWANWAARMALGPVRAYADAVSNGNNVEKKTTAAQAYVAMLDQRDAQLSALASLRQSLLLLADTHTAAANGSTTDASGLVAAISKRVDETQSLLGRFKNAESFSATTKP